MLRFAAASDASSTVLSRLQQEIYDLCGFRPGYAEFLEEIAKWKEEPETSLVLE
jgi:hypothetical protein